MTAAIVIVAALVALVLTVAPVAPGTLAVVAGAVLVGLVDGWEQFDWWFWTIQGVLVIGYLGVDNAAQLLGVRSRGGSRSAMWWGTAGVVVGPLLLAPLLGPFALVLGAPVGAVAGTIGGELLHRRRSPHAAGDARLHELGLGALAALLVSMAVKLAIVSIQVALLVLAVW